MPFMDLRTSCPQVFNCGILTPRKNETRKRDFYQSFNTNYTSRVVSTTVLSEMDIDVEI